MLTSGSLDRATILGGLIGMAVAGVWALRNLRGDPVYIGAQIIPGMAVSFGAAAVFARVIPIMSGQFGKASVLLFLVAFALMCPAYTAWMRGEPLTLSLLVAGSQLAAAFAAFALLVIRVAQGHGPGADSN